jgi:Kdo2-lipid IVA lauroyltransferase/acyltransferase
MLKNAQYAIEFALIRILDEILTLLPRSWVLRFGMALGSGVSFLLPSRRRLVKTNLQQALPERSKDEINRIASEVWKNLGRIAVEFIRLSDLNGKNFTDTVEFVSPDVLREAQAQGKGLIFVGFHFTNWEVTGVAVSAVTKNLLAIARPIKNPLVNKWVLGKRGLGDVEIILHRNAVKGSLKALHEKKSVGILVDQNLYTGGLFTNFFGRKAATTPLPALLFIRTGAPILIAYCLRNGKKFKFIMEKMNFNFDIENSPDAVQRITQTISDRLEQIIRENPESWFWVHNRWKRQPKLNEE